MTPPRAAWPAVLALVLAPLPLLLATRQLPPAADLTLTDRLHHLRSGTTREWSEFPARAEGPALVLAFQSSANRGERTLRLRHRDVKLAWRVRMNDVTVARLPAGEADTIAYWAIPPGALRDGANELRIDAEGTSSDDVLIGQAVVIDRARADVLSEATVDVAVTEAPEGRAVPSRITVTDEQGTLVSLGNVSDPTRAVRPGVVYTRDGTVRLTLPAGRYVLHAGRGFEYGVDRATVDLARGATASRRFSIRREVDTAGWAAMDTHVHTATYAKHGDATIDERMVTIAGEGVELPVSTEHNMGVPFEARAQAAGVRAYFTPVPGTEVTTPTLGHFNVFPLAPAGGAIDHRAPDWAALRRAIDAAGDRPIVVLNHGRDLHGGFRPLGASRHLGVAGEDLDGWTLPANAMEIVNSGAVLSDGLALPRDWMGLLNRGLTLTPVGSSDSHDVARYIVGQGRTYVRCADRQPDRIDPVHAIDSLRAGRVMVSYGLLAEIDVAGHGPGEQVSHAGGDLAVRIRVKGPGWTRADRVALYANGLRVRDVTIRGGTDAGLKWEATWRLPAPSHDVHLAAVALGPGIAAPYWPTAKPYQPTSPDFTPYVLGVSGAVFVDADRNGTFESARAYAQRVLADAPTDRQLAERLARHDGAVATQVASLLRAQDPAGVEARTRSLMRQVPATVADGLQAYLDAWAARR
jgi:hypothetical protein